MAALLAHCLYDAIQSVYLGLLLPQNSAFSFRRNCWEKLPLEEENYSDALNTLPDEYSCLG
jgi:hypothetical protein